MGRGGKEHRNEEKGKEGRSQGAEKREVARIPWDSVDWGAARWVAPFLLLDR
jgi:hypothetical protein